MTEEERLAKYKSYMTTVQETNTHHAGKFATQKEWAVFVNAQYTDIVGNTKNVVASSDKFFRDFKKAYTAAIAALKQKLSSAEVSLVFRAVERTLATVDVSKGIRDSDLMEPISARWLSPDELKVLIANCL